MSMRFPGRAEGAICHFFAEGRCRSGARCAFLHIVQTDGFAHSQMMPTLQDVQNFQNFQNFATGMPFAPGEFPPAGPGQPRSTPIVKKPAAPKRTEEANLVMTEEHAVPEEAWVRYIKGAYVTFGTGATVGSVAMPWEYSAVRLTKLPKDFHRSTIADHFHHKLGIQVPEAQIDPQPMWGGEDVADVTMNDPEFATKLVRALEEDETVQFKGMPVVPPQFRAARFNDISSSRVNCSWHKPSRTAWLNFALEANASKVYRQFADGVFRVDGNRVLPERPALTEGVSTQSWGLKITNVPASAGRSEIIEDIPFNLRPTHIELSRASYSIPVEAAVNEITNMLMQVGPLESSVVASAEGHGRRFKLSARFVDANDASDAVKILNYKSLPFYPHGKLTVQQVFTVRMKVPDHIYVAASQDIEALARYWTSQYIMYSVSPAHKSFRNIRIEGQSLENVTKAQAELDNIMSGAILTDEGEPLWSASFATNAWAYTQMRDLERRLGVLVLRDRQERTLRMLGPRDMFGPARLELLDLCNKDPRQEFSVRLDAEALPWLLQGGYQYIARAVGVDKVGLDIVSEPRRIIITGSQADHSVAQDIYLNRNLVPEPDVELGSQDCTICGSLAEYPVFTRCCHLYCASCFEDMCLSSAATYVRTPAIRCYGDFGRCKELLTLGAIQENITSSALERVFEKMFTTFIASNAKQYRYCPTSGCGQVYRLDARPEGEAPVAEFEFNCPNCLVAICSTCHVSHDTILCPLREMAGS